MNKVLISYFSASGTTKKVANDIASILNADIFEIEPVELYTTKDLDWHDKNSRTSVEMADKSSRPAIKTRVTNLDSYDKVLIGFPVWWYTAPTIINTFIEENDLSGKDIYIFVTSGGSSDEGSFNDLKNTYPNINFVKSKRFSYTVNDKELNDFIENK